MRAVYRRNERGKFELVAAFAVENTPPLPSDWPREIEEWLNSEGETTKVIECGLNDLTTAKV